MDEVEFESDDPMEKLQRQLQDLIRTGANSGDPDSEWARDIVIQVQSTLRRVELRSEKGVHDEVNEHLMTQDLEQLDRLIDNFTESLEEKKPEEPSSPGNSESKK